MLYNVHVYKTVPNIFLIYTVEIVKSVHFIKLNIESYSLEPTALSPLPPQALPLLFSPKAAQVGGSFRPRTALAAEWCGAQSTRERQRRGGV